MNNTIHMETIQGLTVIPDFITPDQERAIIDEIDASTWNTSLSRRTQHYGSVYSYTTRHADTPAPPIPEWACLPVPFTPTQCIVNEYTLNPRPQGISAHIDSVTQFGPEIATLSLNSTWCMQFTRGPGELVEIPLFRRSLVTMSGPARFEWRHSIVARKSDHIGGRRVPRSDRRISVTYRTLKNTH